MRARKIQIRLLDGAPLNYAMMKWNLRNSLFDSNCCHCSWSLCLHNMQRTTKWKLRPKQIFIQKSSWRVFVLHERHLSSRKEKFQQSGRGRAAGTFLSSDWWVFRYSRWLTPWPQATSVFVWCSSAQILILSRASSWLNGPARITVSVSNLGYSPPETSQRAPVFVVA